MNLELWCDCCFEWVSEFEVCEQGISCTCGNLIMRYGKKKIETGGNNVNNTHPQPLTQAKLKDVIAEDPRLVIPILLVGIFLGIILSIILLADI